MQRLEIDPLVVRACTLVTKCGGLIDARRAVPISECTTAFASPGPHFRFFFFSVDFNSHFGLGFERFRREKIRSKRHRFLKLKEVTEPVFIKTRAPSFSPFGRGERLTDERGSNERHEARHFHGEVPQTQEVEKGDDRSRWHRRR